MGISKVIINNQPIIDLMDDTVTTAHVLNNATFHDSNGDILTGSIPIYANNSVLIEGGTNISLNGYYNNFTVEANASGGSGVVINYYENNVSTLDFTGEEVTLIPKIINENGIYNASSDNVTGYSRVEVNVDSGIKFTANGNSFRHIFNYPVIIDSNSNNTAYFFESFNMFNQPVIIPDNVTDCAYTFYNCNNYNSNVIFGNNVTNCYATFLHCTNFNQPVTIPNSVTNCYAMLRDCTIFNQPVTIPNNVTNCSFMFSGCYNLNSEIVVNYGVRNCNKMFFNCTNFNQPITIPDSVIDCYSILDNAYNFNQDITFGNSVNNLWYALFNKAYMTGNIYINNVSASTKSIVARKNNSLPINIYCNDLTRLSYTNNDSVINTAITWTPITNGYYNATYNIYLYNNYSAETGVIP